MVHEDDFQKEKLRPQARMDLDDHGPAEVEKAVPHHGSLATNGTSSELPWVEK
jgi:hypothetical protein